MHTRRHSMLTLLALLMLLLPMLALQPAYAQSGGGDSQPSAASGSGSSGGSSGSATAGAGGTTVSVHHSETTWYANPLWIVIGLVALAVIIGLIVAAGRSRNTTTVIKD